MKKELFFYIVEGETEQKLVETLKQEKKIKSGKIKVLNIVQSDISNIFLRTIAPDTTVILIFDTDIKRIDILEKNIKSIKNNKNIKGILFVPQILTLEDELIYSTNINKVEDLLNTLSKKDFKTEFNNCSNLYQRLLSKKFDINKIWSRNCNNTFKEYKNDSQKIKK